MRVMTGGDSDKMKRKDIMLTAVLLLIAVTIYAAVRLGDDAQGNLVEVTLNGREYGVYSLHEDKELVADSEMGYNKIVIADGEVYIQDADCPDKYCVHQGRIHKNGETLICLPHKLSVKIKAVTGGSDIDAVAE